jgi:hypothetical protein
MAKYLLLIYGDEQAWATMPTDDSKRHRAAHEAFWKAAGSGIISSKELEPSATATTLRGDEDGGYTTTDGPFLETKEALGGYYLVEAADLDAAIALAAQLPEAHARHSGIEIRPVVGG